MADPIGARLRYALDLLQMSQSELARRIGKPPQRIQDIVKQRAGTPKHGTMAPIIRALNDYAKEYHRGLLVTLDDLYAGTGIFSGVGETSADAAHDGKKFAEKDEQTVTKLAHSRYTPKTPTQQHSVFGDDPGGHPLTRATISRQPFVVPSDQRAYGRELFQLGSFLVGLGRALASGSVAISRSVGSGRAVDDLRPGGRPRRKGAK